MAERSVGALRSQTPVCVLGMHRSGTSMFARMMNLLGVALGPQEKLLPPQPDNPKGFWEYSPFVITNDQIFDRYGGTWDAPPALPRWWWRRPRVLDLRLRVHRAARRDFDGGSLWGWKDPRASLTLPFWQSMFPKSSTIICVRNPLDVARSLEVRGGMPIEQGVALWGSYCAGALRNTSGRKRLVVSYEDGLADPIGAFVRMARFIHGDAGDKVARAAVAQLDDAVDPTAQHGASSAAVAAESSAVSADAAELYQELLRMSKQAPF